MTMKKYILHIVFIILIGIVTFISAGTMTGGNDSPYLVEIDVVKGWNIVAGIMPNEAITTDSQIRASDIKAVWYYAPNLKKYVQIHPNVDMSAQIDDDVALTSAMWVYSDKAGRLKYSTLEDYMPLSNRKLSSGYNFVTITPDMTIDINNAGPEEELKYTLNAMKGDCNIEKVYGWNNQEISGDRNWDAINTDFTFTPNLIGRGILIKVSNNCKFSKSAEETNQPPQLP